MKKIILSTVVLVATLAAPAIFGQIAGDYDLSWHSIGNGGGTSTGGNYSLTGSIGQPDASGPMTGGDYTMDGGFESVFGIVVPAVAAFDTNLILNPGAELDAGSISGNDILPVPNWTTTNNFTVAVYDSALPSPGPGFGTNYFAGGPTTRTDASNPFSSAAQMIDLPTLAPNIDAASVIAELSGYFGGFGEQNDRASLTANYLDASGNTLGSFSIGNVLGVDRTNHTALLFRGGTNAVPSGTRKIQVVLSMTNEAGYYYNDGYADNLSLVLRSRVPSITLFDNTSGSDNGGIGVTENTWLASRFCLGSQPFLLDSVSLLLDSQDSSGQAGPPSSLRLQIYSADPVNGKPAASIGVIMNLSGFTNPITPPHGFGLVKWTPATPFSLSANTCYWAVLSREGGGNIGEIASVTMPTGAAGSFGKSQSGDAGATWQAPDNSFNFKMLIEGTPSSPPPPTPKLAADESTTIPGGTGNFTAFPFAPSLSGDNAAFFGRGGSDQQGVYLRNPLTGVAKIADLNTPIPNGAGNFLSFGTEAGIIIVSGTEAGIIIVSGDVLFPAHGSGGQQGIYLADHSNPAAPIRIVDASTVIPNGTGPFTGFQNAPGFDGRDIAFVGSGSGGQQGVYFSDRTIPGNPIRLADTATAIPGGSGNFSAFPSGPALSGNTIAFIGDGLGAQQGLYTVAVSAQAQAGSPVRIADTTTAIPNGNGNFTAFGSDQAHPIDPAMSGDHLAFVGSGSGGQQGVYFADQSIPGNPIRIADTATAMPSGSGNFASFGPVSVSETDVAFLGNGSGGQQGIYASVAQGAPFKVIDLNDTIGGKTIKALNFSRTGLSGDPITFQATFGDGSQGVYTMDVVPPPEALRITSVERSGNDLRLSFTSIAGASYVIESRADLASGSWVAVPGSTISSSGETTQITLLSPLDQPRQFYRVKQVP